MAQRDIYGGVSSFFRSGYRRWGLKLLSSTLMNSSRPSGRSYRTRGCFISSPTNPALRVVDFKKVAALARQHRLMSMIDATFGTPINQHPAEYGIDLVMHSGTKYLVDIPI